MNNLKFIIIIYILIILSILNIKLFNVTNLINFFQLTINEQFIFSKFILLCLVDFVLLFNPYQVMLSLLQNNYDLLIKMNCNSQLKYYFYIFKEIILKNLIFILSLDVILMIFFKSFDLILINQIIFYIVIILFITLLALNNRNYHFTIFIILSILIKVLIFS
jgi:hypothetical protein